MTQNIRDGSQNFTANRLTTMAPDAEMPAPFQALDRLSNVGQRVDAVLSMLIGQLQPYCDENVTATNDAANAVVQALAPSPLEQRIERETTLLMEIALRTEELLTRLRL